MRQTTVLLADDHAILLDGLVDLLAKEFKVVGVAHDGRTLIEIAKTRRPDVIVVDIAMPRLNGIDAARVLQKDLPSGKIIFLTMHDDVSLVGEAFRVGASGFLLKMCDASELVNAIQAVARGATYITPSLGGQLISTLIAVGPRETTRNTLLTPRQREVLQLIAEGKTMKEAADLLGISIRTTETHKYEIMRQLGADTTAALVRYAIRMHLVKDCSAAGSKH